MFRLPPRLLYGLLVLCWCVRAQDNKLETREQPLPPEYEDFGGSNPGGEEVDLPDEQNYQGVQGRAGVDFPVLRSIPKTSFSCRTVKLPGYFADVETDCQVFHLCEGGRKMSFLCPNGTIFRQSKLTCDWWYKVDCKSSEEFYESSAEQLRQDREAPALRRAQEAAAEATAQPKPATRRVSDESQEVAETGSFIIPHRRQQTTPSSEGHQEVAAASSSRGAKALRARAEVNSVTSTSTSPPLTTQQARRRSHHQNSRRVTTTPEPWATEPAPEFTTPGVTERSADLTGVGGGGGELLRASQSSWYDTPTPTPPPSTQEDFNQITFFTTAAPDPVSTTPSVGYASLARLLGRSSTGPDGSSERSARGFTVRPQPRPRPDLTGVPLSSSPETLHSLARYFATADNQTRREIENEVPANTKALMTSLRMPDVETTTSNHNIHRLSPDLRALAKLFSKALSDYLHDPDMFRDTLNSVRPTEPPPLTRPDDEKDEVLDFSDAVNTKKPKTTTPESETTTELPTTEYPGKNEVASIVNDIIRDPEELQARKVPENSNPNLLVNEESRYRFNDDVSTRSYLPSEPSTSSTTPQYSTEDNFLQETIPPATPFPITQEPIPILPSDQFQFQVPYVEIGFNPSTTPNPSPLNIHPTYTNLDSPSLDALLQHFAPKDLNSLAIFSVRTHPAPSPPVSVAVHLPPQTSDLQHRITVVASTHKTDRKPTVTTYRPMISKLLFPAPTTEDNHNSTLDHQESLLVENTAGYPASFRHSQSLIQSQSLIHSSKESILKSWIAEDKSVSQLITESIPTTFAPATTVEPVTEHIPTGDGIQGSAERTESNPGDGTEISWGDRSQEVTTFRTEEEEEVPQARKIAEEGGSNKLVLLLLKNGAPTEPTDEINRHKLLSALLEKDASKSAENSREASTVTPEITTTPSSDPSITVTSPSLTVTPPKYTSKIPKPEITTYRSAQHQRLIIKARESAEAAEDIPQFGARLVNSRDSIKVEEPSFHSQIGGESIESSSDSGELVSRLPPLKLANATHHADSRALDILKSLYSLAARWG